MGFEVSKSSRYRDELPPGFDQFDNLLAWEHELKIESIDVKGKFMYWTLGMDPDLVDNDDKPIKVWIHCTYGMTGQWVFDDSAKHPVVTMKLKDGDHVTFDDTRHFGTVKFVWNDEEHQKKLGTIGPDLFDIHKFEFVDRLKEHPSRTLAEVLMDQRVVSGCGNYIKAESLYLAKFSPHRTVSSLTDDDLEWLFANINTVMINSAAYGGATLRSYRGPNGEPGEYAFRLNIYGKKKDPLGNNIIKEETRDGRTTWWVPEVQK